MIKTDDLYDTYGFAMGPDPDFKHVDTCGCPQCDPAGNEPQEPEVYREMTFSFSELSDDETVDAALTLGITNESTEYLPKIMEEFQKFLRFAGFDYVTLVKLGDGAYGYGSVN